jgi:hypothetical protein
VEIKKELELIKMNVFFVIKRHILPISKPKKIEAFLTTYRQFQVECREKTFKQ